MKLKKIKPITWVIILIVLYFMFFHETETVVFEDDTNDNPNEPQTGGTTPYAGAGSRFMPRRGMNVNPNRTGELNIDRGIDVNPNRDPVLGGKKKSCGGKKCKAVRRRGFLGIGRQVAEDWCHGIPPNCKCLGNPCGGYGKMAARPTMER